jgi:WhiB family transcriptional regulator, redox-sensing transcriptional regulator
MAMAMHRPTRFGETVDTTPTAQTTSTPGGDQMTPSHTDTSLSPALDPDSTTGWMALGLCRMYAPSTFFPSDGVGVDKARKICAGCPVKSECLEHALEHRIEHGVWGGCSERERRRILKRRRDLAS